MTWKELLQADAERRADAEYKTEGRDFSAHVANHICRTCAQLPNERLEKLIEALQAISEADLPSDANAQAHMVMWCSMGVKAKQALADLRKELEGSV